MVTPLNLQNPTEFTLITKLSNSYAAVYINNGKMSFISECLSEHENTARIAAKSFAEQKKIPFIKEVQPLGKPIITIIKHGEKWFPAEIFSDVVNLVDKFGPKSLGSRSTEKAIHIAEVIATYQNTICIPSIGLSLHKRDEQKKVSEKKDN